MTDDEPPPFGQRVGPFVVIVDRDGIRYAVRLGAVQALSDADPTRDATLVQLPAGRCVLLDVTLDEVLAWFA